MSYTWGSYSTDTLLNAQTVTNGTLTPGTKVNNTGQAATEVEVTVAYGGTATTGLVVEIQRDIDGTNFEGDADLPWQFAMPVAVSSTFHRVFTVPATIAAFRPAVKNNSGATVTVTVRTRQATN